MRDTEVLAMEAVRYIETHLFDQLDLSRVAAGVHYSQYHLHRVFSRFAGLTVHAYIRRRRLTEAANLLTASNRSVMEIALMSGYKSQQAFTYIFREVYKKAPGQFRKEAVFYPIQCNYALFPELLYCPRQAEGEPVMKLAELEDIPRWMRLVRLVIDGFPCLHETVYIEELKMCMIQQRAYIASVDGYAVGAMILSRETGRIEFLGIHPRYRRKALTALFLARAAREIPLHKPVSITTYRRGDRADTGYREEYEELGFMAARQLTEFGYPTQEFIWQAERRRQYHG